MRSYPPTDKRDVAGVDEEKRAVFGLSALRTAEHTELYITQEAVFVTRDVVNPHLIEDGYVFSERDAVCADHIGRAPQCPVTLEYNEEVRAHGRYMEMYRATPLDPWCRTELYSAKKCDNRGVSYDEKFNTLAGRSPTNPTI